MGWEELMTPTVTINKSSVPIIWVDTSIIVNITLYRLDRKLDKIQRRRAKFLYEAIKNATRKGKLICPLAYQDEEVWNMRYEFLETIHELSLGIATDSCLSVKKKQVKIFAESFFAQEENINLDYSFIFSTDPVEEMKKIISSQFCLAVDPPLVGGAKKVKSDKELLNSKLNKIRKENIKNGVLFEDQKELEFMAELDVIRMVTKSPYELSKFCLNENDILGNILNVMELLKVWNRVASDNKNSSKSLLDFYRSNYYRKIPEIKISIEFYSKMMTDKHEIRSGDMMDIKHISTALPFFDMFITDNQRKTQLLELRYDKEYKTKVCYAGDEKEIEDFFSSL